MKSRVRPPLVCFAAQCVRVFPMPCPPPAEHPRQNDDDAKNDDDDEYKKILTTSVVNADTTRDFPQITKDQQELNICKESLKYIAFDMVSVILK